MFFRLSRYLITLILLVAGGLVAHLAGAVHSADLPQKKILTWEEKERIGEEMKLISKALDVKCEYCHSDAERGLKNGDYTLLTEEGEYALSDMFPLSKRFRVDCALCHNGHESLTDAGKTAHRDMKRIRKYKRKYKKTITCESCHEAGEKGSEFARLTPRSAQLLKALEK